MQQKCTPQLLKNFLIYFANNIFLLQNKSNVENVIVKSSFEFFRLVATSMQKNLTKLFA